MSRRLTALLLSLLLCLAGCAAPESCALVPLATMPMQIQNNLLFVTAGIGGQPVRLLVDTGAERTALTESAVARLGLPHDLHHLTHGFGIGGPSANWDVLIPELTLGQTQFPVRRLAVLDATLGHGGIRPADGLLGADILLAFDMDIDEPDRRLTLYRVRRCADALPPWPQTATLIGGVETRRDRMLVPITLDGVSGLAILDTGAQSSLVGLTLANRLGLTSAMLATDSTIEAHGAGPAPVPVYVHRFRELAVGDARIESPSLAVLTRRFPAMDALLGGDFLRGRRIWLSFATQRLFISAAATPRLAAAHGQP